MVAGAEAAVAASEPLCPRPEADNCVTPTLTQAGRIRSQARSLCHGLNLTASRILGTRQ